MCLSVSPEKSCHLSQATEATALRSALRGVCSAPSPGTLLHAQGMHPLGDCRPLRDPGISYPNGPKLGPEHVGTSAPWLSSWGSLSHIMPTSRLKRSKKGHMLFAGEGCGQSLCGLGCPHMWPTSSGARVEEKRMQASGQAHFSPDPPPAPSFPSITSCRTARYLRFSIQPSTGGGQIDFI